MKVRLLHRDRDVDWDAALPDDSETLEQDLELGTLLDAMAQGDAFLRDTARRTLVSGLGESDEIRYRQAVLADALAHASMVRDLYARAVQGAETKRDSRFFWFRDSPDSVRQKSLGMLAKLFGILRELRLMTERDAEGFASEGFTRLFETLRRELEDDYLERVATQLKELGFSRGALLSAAAGRGNRGTSYVLRQPTKQRLVNRLSPSTGGLSFTVADRDESGMQTLADIRGRGSARVADALGQSTDHVLRFFASLRAELGFYVACLNVHDQLAARGVATTMPEPRPAAEAALSARRLCDAALAFHLPDAPVSNDLDGDGTRLVIVTGPNQGGKSTFLRSVGLAQLMMQAGMFVCADSYQASVTSGIYTHFKREEDASMTHGKLEEELHRMNGIADRIESYSLVLLNESFAATNEREGSEIAHGVLKAMIEADVRVVFVTHLYDLAQRLRGSTLDHTLYLRAERTPDGQRTFRIVPGEPRPTSHAQDSYRRIFGVTSPAGSER